MKKQLFTATLLLLGLSLSSCSVSTYDNPVDVEEAFVTGPDYDVRVEYHLENAEGIETTTFKEGDNIVFALAVVNNSQTGMTQWRDQFLDSAMKVYDSDGKAVGTPLYAWDEDVEERLNWFPVKAGGRTYWRVPWIYDARLLESNDPTFRLTERDRVKPLKPGRYYTELVIKFKALVDGKEVYIIDEVRRTDFSVE